MKTPFPVLGIRAVGGMPFRRQVWQARAGIPAGESRTYGELARLLTHEGYRLGA